MYIMDVAIYLRLGTIVVSEGYKITWNFGQHFWDGDFSWTLFFRMSKFYWTFSEGKFSWTLLVNSKGHFWCIFVDFFFGDF